jgi:hypothetical protein
MLRRFIAKLAAAGFIASASAVHAAQGRARSSGMMRAGKGAATPGQRRGAAWRIASSHALDGTTASFRTVPARPVAAAPGTKATPAFALLLRLFRKAWNVVLLTT